MNATPTASPNGAQLTDAFSAQFDSRTRLYQLQGDGTAAGLLVESWSQRENLNQPWELQISTLSTNATLDVHTLLGQRVSLLTTLADGHSQHPRSGLITAASALAADGGFARYLLTVSPWLSLLAFGARSAVWQERSVVQIIDSVFTTYQAHAAWAWSPCALAHLGESHQGGQRSTTVQYRETDLAFVQRILAREGLVFRFEAVEEAPLGHKLVILADTTQAASCPEDPTSVDAGGIRFHRASSQEQQDAIQALGGVRQLQAATSSTLVWDYQRKAGITASVHTAVGFAAGPPQGEPTPLGGSDPRSGGAWGRGFAGANAPRLGQFEPETGYTYANEADAQRAMTMAQQALEARHKTWLGRSTVRTFEAGHQVQITQSTLDVLASLGNKNPNSSSSARQSGAAQDQTRFLLTQVIHAGINNLPKDLSARIQQTQGRGTSSPSTSASTSSPGRIGAVRAAMGAAALTSSASGSAPGLAPLATWVPSEVARQAQASGYGNSFQAIRAYVPWREALYADDGTALHPVPRPGGPLVATVVGPDGSTSGTGAGEIHTDRLGRIRIRFDFQAPEAIAHSTTTHTNPETSNSSTWVRVMQRLASCAMGRQFIPRVGQSVLVDFVDGQIQRPIVIAALYDGQGEAGLSPTPGGTSETSTSDTTALGQSSDHRPSAQANRVARGHSPAWHGAGGASLQASGQANASALNGIKSQEFGHSASGAGGYNQLVFDDTPGQLRVQFMTTQHATQLNLGHLIHQADNHRGSLRGAGFELRSDAYGAISAARGVLITSYGPTGTGHTPTGQSTREPAGDNAAGMALAQQLKTLGQRFNQAASTHQTTTLAAHIGSTQAGQSSLAPAGAKPEAALAAWHTSLKGMVQSSRFDEACGDASQKNTTTAQGKVPASADPTIAIHARAGWATVAGQDVHHSAADNITLASGQSTHWATGGAYRVHSGQSIGVLAGAVQAGTQAAGQGLTLIAAQGDTQLQAQSNSLQIAARQQLSIQSETANIDWAAARKITLATAGGASIVIEGGNITVMCPGTITVQAGSKAFVGPEGVSYGLPLMPRQVCVACLLSAQAAGAPFAQL
jgi:type VI secretion system secreted protein VgrG